MTPYIYSAEEVKMGSEDTVVLTPDEKDKILQEVSEEEQQDEEEEEEEEEKKKAEEKGDGNQ